MSDSYGKYDPLKHSRKGRMRDTKVVQAIAQSRRVGRRVEGLKRGRQKTGQGVFDYHTGNSKKKTFQGYEIKDSETHEIWKQSKFTFNKEDWRPSFDA